MQLLPPGDDTPNVQNIQLDKPVTLQQSVQDCQTLDAHRDVVEAWGWRWTDGAGEITITHAPCVLGRSLSPTDLQVAAVLLGNLEACWSCIVGCLKGENTISLSSLMILSQRHFSWCSG
jgi:hypothetical protein